MATITAEPDIAILEQDTCLSKRAFNVFRNMLSLVQPNLLQVGPGVCFVIVIY